MNHIAVIQKTGQGKLYVCGTNSFKPKDWLFEPDLRKYSPYPPAGSGVAKCPFNPNDPSTAVWIEKGNPSDIPSLYSGTQAHFSSDPLIYRPSLFNDDLPLHDFIRTSPSDSKWLNQPKFVGSFDMGDYVYFFFRETAVEYINCGKRVYSRVARVCKKDNGGQNVLMQHWTTYMKARLNCSIPGAFPFYFDEIQDVYRSPDNDTVFHAVFTTSLNGLVGSAVCMYSFLYLTRISHLPHTYARRNGLVGSAVCMYSFLYLTRISHLPHTYARRNGLVGSAVCMYSFLYLTRISHLPHTYARRNGLVGSAHRLLPRYPPSTVR
ncbi:PREDICTED: semaphorin-2A-like [Priapulus caudatus]|uniref:Semaphorin-2A-like n=1 Tax=Priapulus caudatus TaxID=37621 RepID=A0ABM1DSA0_PRICU|nr:PREDICTED: semaphorin-2A-like [Priapulus caudatus]